MAAVFRVPLAPRAPHQLPTTVSPLNTKKVLGATFSKRPRSPDPHNTHAIPETVKRHKPTTSQTKDNQDAKDKERRRIERDAQKEEFRLKYSKAFPSWTFYFDTTDAERDQLVPRVLQLNGRIAKFFSNEVTHFITNRPVPESEAESNKENSIKSKPSGTTTLRSPIKLKGLPVEEVSTSGYETLIRKAKQFGMKIWETAKLDSVLQRCSISSNAPGASNQTSNRSLTSLLESERRHGTTSERDPTQKRHDYRYFSKGSCFVLVEDMRQEFATIAAQEYVVTRTSDGVEKGSWPVPHCHPLSRNPFVEYNDKEERRREKQERLEREREEERAVELKKFKMKQLQRKQHDLRRSVSMNNLHREARKNNGPLEGETYEVYDTTNTGNAVSGCGGSTGPGDYIAASGNSVGITSTYGTTSTIGAGSSMRSGLGQSQFPPGLRGRLQNQVVTSRRVTAVGKDNGSGLSKASASSAMMPPPDVPERRIPLLRKSKSTNTMRLPKRDEKSKPGYCESCRMKFDDFKSHIKGRKHQKFASNDANFLQLDYVLGRVRRPTIAEVEAEERAYARSQNAENDALGDDSDTDKENDPAIPDSEQYIYLDDDDEELANMDEEP